MAQHWIGFVMNTVLLRPSMMRGENIFGTLVSRDHVYYVRWYLLYDNIFNGLGRLGRRRTAHLRVFAGSVIGTAIERSL